MSDVPAIQKVIRKLHGCESRHVESVPVTETFRGKTVWSGEVEVFELIGHPQVKRCYGWVHEREDGGWRYVTVLELPPVDSAQRAVQVAIAAEVRPK